MQAVLFFLIKKQFKEVFLSKKRYKFFTYSLIVVLASFFIGSFIAKYYDLNIEKNIIDPQKFLLMVNSILAISFLLIDFIPVFKMNPFLFPNYYPLKNISKASIILFIYSLKYYIAFVYLTLISFSICSTGFGIIELIHSFIFIYCGYLVNRIFKNLTEYTVSKAKIILLLTITSTAGYLSYLYFFFIHPIWNNMFLITFFVVLFICFMHSETDKKIRKGSFSSSILLAKNFFVKIAASKNLSKSYLPAFLFKVLWLLLAAIMLRKEGKPPFGNYQSMWMFASPLLVLIYTGINFFGYNKNLFFTHIIREYKIENLAKAYIKSMGVILIIDTCIFWIFLILTGLYKWEIILFYYTLLIILSSVCFWFALHRPIFTNSILLYNIDGKNSGTYYGGVAVAVILYFVTEWSRSSDYQVIISTLLLVSIILGFIFYKYNFSTISRYAFRRMKGS